MRSGAKRHYSICLFEIKKKKKKKIKFNLCEPLQGFTKINFYLFSESFSSSPFTIINIIITSHSYNRNSIIFSFSYNLKVPSIVSKYIHLLLNYKHYILYFSSSLYIILLHILSDPLFKYLSLFPSHFIIH